VNEVGDVIGGASLPTLVFEFQSVMWRGSEFIDIGVLPGDTCSQPYFINSRDQVVGASAADCNFTSIRAYIWEKGEIVDLNTLIPANAGIHLEYANWINEHGEIAAEGVLSSNGNAAAVLLVPDCDCGDRCEAQIQSAEKTAPPPAAANGPSKESAMRRFLRPGSMAVH
jgi:hypothetical protein